MAADDASDLTAARCPRWHESAAELPDGDGWLFERKWDGFRTIVFVDGDDMFVQSRNGKPMSRYFPELSFPPAATCWTASW